MLNLQHNMVSLLYSIKSMIESHLCQVKEECFLDQPERRMRHAEEILERCLRQTERAIQVTKRLSRLLKAKEGDQESLRQKVSIAYAWKTVSKHLRENYDMRHIEIVERIPEDFAPILCDRTELYEILCLLATNSLQAMDSNLCLDRKLVIRVQHAYSLKEEPFAIITVADTGPGISEKILSDIFNPFYTTKPKGKGNGIGLYIVRELVAKNRGRITVSSVEGFGTSFALELPIHACECQTAKS